MFDVGGRGQRPALDVQVIISNMNKVVADPVTRTDTKKKSEQTQVE